MADCFIIMPIFTPDFLIPKYANDGDHFRHVLDCLFVPAVQKAGLNPILPIAKGADVIHAEIIQNLEKADIVLCDMSFLNANVFFELGIRTAIGKPVCVVKDDATPNIPFDMMVVNCHEYASALPAWTLGREVENLAEHLKSSLERSAGKNMLWKYFGLSQRAQLTHPTPKDETHDRLAMLSTQVEGLGKKLDAMRQSNEIPGLPGEERMRIRPPNRFGRAYGVMQQVVRQFYAYAHGKDFKVMQVTWSSPNFDAITVYVEGKFDKETESEMRKIASSYDLGVDFIVSAALL